MECSLNLNVLPQYCFSSYRFFQKKEKHVTRYCNEDVMIMMYGGVLRFREDGKDVELTSGEYYIQRRKLYQEGVKDSNLAQYYYIHFIGDFSEDEMSIPIRGNMNFGLLIPHFNKLEQLQNLSYPDVCAVEKNAEFYAILSRIRSSSANKGHSALVRKATSIAMSDISRPISMSELARECGYCENHLINVFRKETGKTPHAYITALRIDRACRLLEESDVSISYIAEYCGFGEYVNLYKHFVSVKGMSPAKWRKLRRNGKMYEN